jgi:hypothetical protein
MACNSCGGKVTKKIIAKKANQKHFVSKKLPLVHSAAFYCSFALLPLFPHKYRTDNSPPRESTFKLGVVGCALQGLYIALELICKDLLGSASKYLSYLPTSAFRGIFCSFAPLPLFPHKYRIDNSPP